jgi:acyl-CoA synthetase (AMP-forming)/AMP-acid ligase II
VRGANHAPDEFETALAGVPGLRPGCAVALGWVPPGADGEELLLLAERARGRARGDDQVIVEAAREAVLARTGVRPGTVVLLAPGTLPRTSSGKLRRAEALRRFQAGTLRPPRNVNLATLAGAVVRGTVAGARARGRSRR